MKYKILFLIFVSTIFLLFGCESEEENGNIEESGLSVNLVTVINSSHIDPGIECTFGGIKIEIGIDENGNGYLDSGEVDKPGRCLYPKSCPRRGGAAGL